MSEKLFILAVFSSLLIIGLAMNDPIKDHFRNGISIYTSENKHELSLTARYPRKEAKEVHEFIRQHFSLSDLTEMGSVEIKNYQTPDRFINCSIKSRDGFIRIKMNKDINSQAALDRLREAAEKLKGVLVGA